MTNYLLRVSLSLSNIMIMIMMHLCNALSMWIFKFTLQYYMVEFTKLLMRAISNPAVYNLFDGISNRTDVPFLDNMNAK